MDDGQEQDQYEERLKEVFNGFDASGSGSLCLEELSELCQSLHLDDATPALLQTLLQNQDPHTARVSSYFLIIAGALGSFLGHKCVCMRSTASFEFPVLSHSSSQAFLRRFVICLVGLISPDPRCLSSGQPSWLSTIQGCICLRALHVNMDET